MGIRTRGGSNAVKKSALQEDNLGSISLSFSVSCLGTAINGR